MLLARLLDLYSLIVLVAVILSWSRVDPRNPVSIIVHSLTEPILGPIRRALPPMGGLDFSPMLLLLVLQVLKGFIR
jgi:YggT family protein